MASARGGLRLDRPLRAPAILSSRVCRTVATVAGEASGNGYCRSGRRPEQRLARLPSRGVGRAGSGRCGYIFSFVPREISHQFTGKVVAKPSTMAICIMNQ